MKAAAHRRKHRGAAMVEFALVALMTCILLFAGFEFARLALVFSDVASAARIGLRYAMTHGSKRSGTPGTPEGPATVSQIQDVVRDYAKGLLDKNRLQITVTYPDTFNSPGFPVEIAVNYSYDPFARIFPVGTPLQLKTVTRGIITY